MITVINLNGGGDQTINVSNNQILEAKIGYWKPKDHTSKKDKLTRIDVAKTSASIGSIHYLREEIVLLIL